MRQRSKLFLGAIALTLAQPAFSCGEIKPNKEITKLVTRLAYRNSFPTAPDIFAIIRIESAYREDAKNESSRESSHGLMQVQDGPFNPRENIARGVALLREYYMLTGSAEGAVKSYNIGPANYLHGKLRPWGEAYYDKFMLQRTVYSHYPRHLTNLGKTLGCGKENGIPRELQNRLSEITKRLARERKLEPRHKKHLH